MIPWTPIDQIPEALKDGRPVLLWVDGSPLTATWSRGGWELVEGGEYAASLDVYGEPTHFAEINAPGEGAGRDVLHYDALAPAGSPPAYEESAQEVADFAAGAAAVTVEGWGNLSTLMPQLPPAIRQRFYPAFGMMATFDPGLPPGVVEFRDPQTGALLASIRLEGEQ